MKRKLNIPPREERGFWVADDTINPNEAYITFNPGHRWTVCIKDHYHCEKIVAERFVSPEQADAWLESLRQKRLANAM